MKLHLLTISTDQLRLISQKIKTRIFSNPTNQSAGVRVEEKTAVRKPPSGETTGLLIMPCPKAAEPIAPAPNEFDVYVGIVKSLENDRKVGFHDGRFYPIKAPEDKGGYDIAYGHKLLTTENYLNGITEEEAVQILKKDISLKTNSAKNVVDRKYPGAWDKFDEKTKLFLTDYQFNTKSGLEGFPKMLKAVVDNDWVAVSKEYKRYWYEHGIKKELKKRNEKVFDHFIKPKLSEV